MHGVGQPGHYSSAAAVPLGSACSAPGIPSPATATAAVTQRSPGEFSSPSHVLLLPVGTLDIFLFGEGGGGGGGCVIGDRVFVRQVLFCFDFRINVVVNFYLCMLVYIPS